MARIEAAPLLLMLNLVGWSDVACKDIECSWSNYVVIFIRTSVKYDKISSFLRE